jgi:hypothetical protein
MFSELVVSTAVSARMNPEDLRSKTFLYSCRNTGLTVKDGPPTV